MPPEATLRFSAPAEAMPHSGSNHHVYANERTHPELST